MPTLDWIGKQAVLNHHNEVPFHLLRCNPELSVGENGGGNLLVQGDNLLALKALLPYYAGQVKCIYIDPPYNTGNEGWVYNDNVNSPEMRDWLGKVVGGEAEDLSRHDKWLCMMYPRLALLRDFLCEDGIIFVSVDENEHRHLELVMDELYGHVNHIETLIWKKSYGGGAKSKHVVNLHEYIVCFAKNILRIPQFELPPSQDVLKYYKYQDDKFSLRGPYRLQPLATTSMDARPNLRYPIHYQGHEIWPDKQWQWSRDRVEKALINDELIINKRGSRWTVSYKQYLRDESGAERSQKPYSIIEGIYTQQGTQEIQKIFGNGKAFSFPKPSALVKYLIQFRTKPGDIILDSFAGSGTTGHAVLQQNTEDRGNRRFILIELDPNIAHSITAERLKRIAQSYSYQDQKGNEKFEPGLGGGFRYCELGPTLFAANGQIRSEVSFLDLARHIFFTETGQPLPGDTTNECSPFLGVSDGRAVYLLYNGVLRDAGNTLTPALLESLPAFDGPKVIYADGCLVGRERLRSLNASFKQIPYEIRTR